MARRAKRPWKNFLHVSEHVATPTTSRNSMGVYSRERALRVSAVGNRQLRWACEAIAPARAISILSSHPRAFLSRILLPNGFVKLPEYCGIHSGIAGYKNAACTVLAIGTPTTVAAAMIARLEA